MTGARVPHDVHVINLYCTFWTTISPSPKTKVSTIPSRSPAISTSAWWLEHSVAAKPVLHERRSERPLPRGPVAVAKLLAGARRLRQ
jgi:hypothetical protein